MGGGGGGAPAFDVDAQAFFDRVTAAGGTLSTTEKQAVNQLVVTMKADGTWGPCKAIYPMVGASAAACAQNLKSSSFTGSFSSGWTFASTGITGNGTSAFFNTTFNTNTNQTVNNCSMSVYVRTGLCNNGYADMGNANSPSYLPLTTMETGSGIRQQFCWDYNSNRYVITTVSATGMWGVSRSGVTTAISFERNTAVSKTSTTSETSLPNLNVYLGATNLNTGASQFSNREIAFSHLGDSFTSTQFNNFYTAVQAFQTTLGRAIAPS